MGTSGAEWDAGTQAAVSLGGTAAASDADHLGLGRRLRPPRPPAPWTNAHDAMLAFFMHVSMSSIMLLSWTEF